MGWGEMLSIPWAYVGGFRVHTPQMNPPLFISLKCIKSVETPQNPKPVYEILSSYVPGQWRALGQQGSWMPTNKKNVFYQFISPKISDDLF